MTDEPLSSRWMALASLSRCQVHPFRTSFFKSDDEPRLVQSPAMSVEKEAPSDKRRAFEALAWEVADAKARELGWIA